MTGEVKRKRKLYVEVIRLCGHASKVRVPTKKEWSRLRNTPCAECQASM